MRRLKCCEKRLAGSSFWYVLWPVRMEPPGVRQADDELLRREVLLSSIENIQVWLKSRESKRHLLHCTALDCTALHCTALHCTALHCMVLILLHFQFKISNKTLVKLSRSAVYDPRGLTFNNFTFCPHSVFMCFVWISEQTAIISLYSIN